MEMQKPTISTLFNDAAQKLRSDFEYIRSSNPHAGEKGAEVEEILKTFLNQHLPGAPLLAVFSQGAGDGKVNGDGRERLPTFLVPLFQSRIDHCLANRLLFVNAGLAH